MNIFLLVVAWLLLLVVAWPLALLALVLAPFIWLLSIPFRIIGAAISALIAFIKALFMLPARLLGYRSPASSA